MEPIVAITAFNIDRYTTVEAFLEEYQVIGLNTIELNGRVRQHVIDDLMPYIERGEIRISSLHNFCPRPNILDKVDLRLSSVDEQARKLAVAHTQNTIAAAHRLGAKAIVLHCGEILSLRPLVNKLKELYTDAKQDGAESARVRSELLERRRQEQMAYVSAAERSIVELAEYVARKDLDVKLGLETRDYYGQIPQIQEYDVWFEQYADLPIYLWYDFGHAAILENLGLANRKTLLERHGTKLLGLHLHDCTGIHDHIVPGTGNVDFETIAPHLRPDVLRVLEYGRRVHPISKIGEGVRYLRQKGIL